jgi:hypothetical protein
MNASQQPSGSQAGHDEAATESAPDRPADIQPAPSGTGTEAANRGSPATPVMKQFAKTQAEGTGRA